MNVVEKGPSSLFVSSISRSQAVRNYAIRQMDFCNLPFFIQKYIYVYYSKLIYINIYGDNLKETFLNIFGMQKKKNTPLESPRSKLSFIITDDYPDKVLEKSGEWKILGTRGREMLYSLYALGLDKKAYDAAERIKGALIERRSLLGYPKEIGTKEAIQGSVRRLL